MSEERLDKIEKRLENQDEINKEIRNALRILGRRLNLE